MDKLSPKPQPEAIMTREKSDINFAVPDERYLCTQDGILGQIIQPGIIEGSMNMLKNHKDIVLMANCK